MARSLVNANKVLANAATIFDALSLSLNRGYAGAAQARNQMVGKVEDNSMKVNGMKQESSSTGSSSSSSSSSWVPDPVTGYYKPCDHQADVDPAELRLAILNNYRTNKPQ